MKIKEKTNFLVNKAFFAVVGVLMTCPAFAEEASDFCKLIEKLQGVFKTLRILAFVGAAFMLASWAWGYISSGKAELKDVKDKGIGLLVGFSILFMIGFIIGGVLSAAGPGGSLGCPLDIGW